MRRIDIAPLTPEGGSLTGYLHDPDNAYIHRGPRPALLVIPGGGYRKLVEHEGDPVAWEFFTAGFHTFVLTYSIWREDSPAPLGWTPLAQAAQALRLIRAHASEWDVHPRRVAVMGFSAGGHLAGSCAVLWDRPELRDRLGAADEENRPMPTPAPGHAWRGTGTRPPSTCPARSGRTRPPASCGPPWPTSMCP